MHIFSGGGGGEFSAGVFPWVIPWGGKFSGSELVRENYKLRKFARILTQNYFYMPCFLFSVSILCAEWLRVIVRGKFSLGLNCLEDISMARGFLRRGWVRFPGIN